MKSRAWLLNVQHIIPFSLENFCLQVVFLEFTPLGEGVPPFFRFLRVFVDFLDPTRPEISISEMDPFEQF